MKTAVSIILIKDNQHILAVSRKENSSMFGLPGGKVDPGESSEDAIVRETFEETGVVVDRQYLIPTYSGICHGDVTFWVTTYVYLVQINDQPILTEEGVIYRWSSIKELIDPDQSPFWDYNEIALTAMAKFFVALAHFEGIENGKS